MFNVGDGRVLLGAPKKQNVGWKTPPRKGKILVDSFEQRSFPS